MLYEEITSKILAAFHAVYNKLGYGFLERVYENALTIELQSRGLRVQQQTVIDVYYEGQVVGKYYADLLVDESVIIELKATDEIVKAHENLLINYLKAQP